LEIFVAFEKRTDGKFLYAGPPYREDGVQKYTREIPEITGTQCEFPTSRKTGETWGTPCPRMLFADAEFGNNALVTLGIVFLEVVEQTTPLAHQHEKAAARAVVFLVRLEVLRQLANALAEQRDLHLGTAGVGRVRAMLVNEGSLMFSG
jgi:hypothetical protein